MKLVFKNGAPVSRMALARVLVIFGRDGFVRFYLAEDKAKLFIERDGYKLDQLRVAEENMMNQDLAESIMTMALSFLGDTVWYKVEEPRHQAQAEVVRFRLMNWNTHSGIWRRRRRCYAEFLNHLSRTYKNRETVSIGKLGKEVLGSKVLTILEWEYVRKQCHADGVLQHVEGTYATSRIYLDRVKDILATTRFH